MFLITVMRFWVVVSGGQLEGWGNMEEYGEAIRGWHDQTTEHKQTVAPQTTDNSATPPPHSLQAEPGLLFPSKHFLCIVINGQERVQMWNIVPWVTASSFK